MLNAMVCTMLHIVEQLIELVFDLMHHSRALIIFGIMVVVVIKLALTEVLHLKVARLGVLRPITISVMMAIMGFVFMSPVIRAMLNSMRIMVLVHMLWVVLTLIIVRVVVTKVMITLRLNVVVLSVLLSSKMTFISEMRHMVLQVPVSLLEVSIWVVLETMDKLSHVWRFFSVSMLEGSFLVVDVICT